MVGRARAFSYHLDTPQFVRALFDIGSDEATLLELAACGHIDLYAEGKSWNAVLWLAMNVFQGSWTPAQLGAMKEDLPVNFL
tara:strand:+ start:173 stop:418 length:246 start_codon:yes stop_codon:yes gene_type:complete